MITFIRHSGRSELIYSDRKQNSICLGGEQVSRPIGRDGYVHCLDCVDAFNTVYESMVCMSKFIKLYTL